jgi:hypothetical protein
MSRSAFYHVTTRSNVDRTSLQHVLLELEYLPNETSQLFFGFAWENS